MPSQAPGGSDHAIGLPPRRRMLLGYVVLLGGAAAIIAGTLIAGANSRPAVPVHGVYESESSIPCAQGTVLELLQSGQFLNVATPATQRTSLSGSIDLDDRRLTGTITCADRTAAAVDLEVQSGEDRGLPHVLTGTIGDDPVELRQVVEEGVAVPPGHRAQQAPPQRSNEETFGRLMLAIAAVMLAARVGGVLMARLGHVQL